jgi:hypothetical protein
MRALFDRVRATTAAERIAAAALVLAVATGVLVLATLGDDSDVLSSGEDRSGSRATGAPATSARAATAVAATTTAPDTTTSAPASTVASTSSSAPRSSASPAATASPAPVPPPPAPPLPPPATSAPPAPPPPGTVLDVPAQYATLQAALDAAGPGTTIRLSTPGDHAGPAVTRRDGAPGAPIVVTAVPGARLSCPGGEHRCLELQHSWYRVEGFSIAGGTSNLYLVGPSPGAYVHDVKIVNSTFRGRNGTGECIRVKYQAFNVEIAGNDIADCGLGKCCDGSKNGEAVYVGTAPEQLADKNPSPEPDRTHDVWIHHNVMHPWNECVDIKEASYAILVEHNTCGGQRDPDSGAFGSRGGRVGEGNTFRFNVVENAVGACVRFGGDADPDGTGNAFENNVCRDIAGEYGVKQMRLPQGLICGNRFEGTLPSERRSRDETVDPTAPC